MAYVDLVLTVAIVMAIWGLLALGLNLNWGDTGLLNFAHVAFFGAGAYTTAILTVPAGTGMLAERIVGFDLPIVVGIVAGTIVAGILGLLFALPSKILRTDYFAIVTLAFAEIFRLVVTNEAWLTGGVNGLNEIPRPLEPSIPFTYEFFYFPFVLAMLIASYVVFQRLTESPFGRLLHAIREDEDVPMALGKNTYLAKIKSFGISAALAGLAGGLWAHYSHALTPIQLLPNLTFLIWAAIILGGAGNHLGAIVGTVVLVFIREGTRLLPQDIPFGDDIQFLRLVLIGSLLVAVLYFRPQGILGDQERLAAGTDIGGGGGGE